MFKNCYLVSRTWFSRLFYVQEWGPFSLHTPDQIETDQRFDCLLPFPLPTLWIVILELVPKKLVTLKWFLLI